jgi:pimeloyl-ACP methyl ester carboxylesterase
MGRRFALITFLLAFLVPAAPGRADPAVHVVDGLTDDWASEPTMVPGPARYDAGEWSFTDYPYDDRGAGGDFAYPSGYGANAADVVVLRIAADDDAVHYLVELDTMLAADSTVVALAVDSDGDDATGGGAWPLGADLSTPGWEFVVSVWGTDGVVTRSDGSEAHVPVAADTTKNVIEFAVPRSVADPGTSTWRYRGGAGVWDRTQQTWAEVVAVSPSGTEPAGGADAAGQPDVFNLLFRNRTFDGGTDATDENSSGTFQFARQSAALAAGDVSAFVRSVDFGLLASAATVEPAYPRDDANFTRVLVSAPNVLAEGVTSAGGAGGRLYNGRFQPYIMFVPASYWSGLPAPAPLLPMLHGWTGDHRGFNPNDNAFWTDVVRANRVLVPKPLGRGQEMWYEHVGELDVLEVIADVRAHYAVDDDRIFLGGTSMGGLGTVKIAEAHPDLFAGIVPSVPPMSDRAAGYAHPALNDWDLVEQADSLRNVPVRDFTGTYDPLVPVGYDSKRLCDRLATVVYDHDCWRDISQGGTHRGYENDRAPQIAQLLAEHTLVRNPERVTYEIQPAWRQQAIDAGIGSSLPYDGAYWVSGISYEARSAPLPNGYERRVFGQNYGVVDVRTFGLGIGEPVATPIADDPDPLRIRSGLVLAAGPPVPTENRFTGSFANVSAADIDLARAGLALGEVLHATLTGDGSLALGLVGAGDGCSATLDGVGVPASRDGTRLVLDLTLDAHASELIVSCGG